MNGTTTDATLHPLAGQPAPPDMLIDVDRLTREFLEREPDPSVPGQLVKFGTSGHRGTPGDGTFTAAHITAIAQAICDYRRSHGIDGPLYMGKDTHALSAPAQSVALAVLAGNGVHTVIQRDGGVTPTPAISRAILTWNRGRSDSLADGIVVTPSHNPPEDGGFKYNPPNGGPADTDVTRWIQQRANEILAAGNAGVKRLSAEAALDAATTRQEDLITPYVDDLGSVVDLDAIRAAALTIGVDPLGGAGAPYWEAIASHYRLEMTIVNPAIDPTFGFMTLDHDGRIRMDCSSPYAMARLVALKDRFQVACGTDPDADRHGIVTASVGLMNPNHFLAVAIQYLLANRPQWRAHAGIGKTIVSSFAHRSGHRGRGQAAGRGTGGIQVVRGAALRRRHLLWRRGERRGQLPATKRRGVVDRQGRADHGPARGGDHSPDREGSGRALPRSDGTVRDAALHEDRPTGHTRAEGEAAEAVAGYRHRDTARRRDNRQQVRRARPTASQSTASRSSRRAAGSRHGRQGRRTSTRSTRRAS